MFSCNYYLLLSFSVELKIESVVADLSVPFPFGDYELTARGVWKFLDEDLTIKVTRSISREMTLSGSLHEGWPQCFDLILHFTMKT